MSRWLLWVSEYDIRWEMFKLISQGYDVPSSDIHFSYEFIYFPPFKIIVSAIKSKLIIFFLLANQSRPCNIADLRSKVSEHREKIVL